MKVTKRLYTYQTNYTGNHRILHDINWLTLDEIELLDKRYAETWYTDVKTSVATMHTLFRPNVCLVCAQYLGKPFDLHHAIVTRQDVRGWKYVAGPYDAKITRLLLITNELNCIPLHHQCHLDNPPTRESAWEYQANFYGEELMRSWYESLPWKSGVPRKLW